ncbi:MAG: hypothetical protein AB8B65_00575 [Kordia sp.]|uniref:hypothetical protein n=1 Tax=Kordia sp. TaxID=1965332 RepID=UPI003859A13E
MLKVTIWPAHINKSLFELKEDTGEWTLLVTKESCSHFKDAGNVWTQKQIDPITSKQIVSKAKKVVIDPTSDERIILGGVSVRIKLKIDAKETSTEFRSPISKSKEQCFMRDLIGLVKRNMDDLELQNYIELLEQHFFNSSPIKVIDKKPYQIKLIGGLTISDKEELMSKFETLQSKKNPILDMTNFYTTGRILNVCFKAIENVEGLTVLANKNAFSYLKEIGFDLTKIKV